MMRVIAAKKIVRSTAQQGGIGRRLKRDYQLYLLALPAVIYLFVFVYVPMYGVQIAFKNYVAAKGIWASSWVGQNHTHE